MNLVWSAVLAILAVNTVTSQDIIKEILDKLGLDKLGIGGGLPKPGDVRGDSRIETLTEALTAGPRANGESCFTRNVAGQNVTAITVEEVKKLLLDCDEQWLRYRLLREKGDGKDSVESDSSCLVKERTNEKVWRDDYQYRHVYLPKGKDYRDIEPPSDLISCRSGTSRERSQRYLNAQKQICIDMRRAVEAKCHSCRLIALVKEPHRSNVAKCMVDHLDYANRFSRQALRYCTCMEQHDGAGFPIANCKERKTSNSRTSAKPKGILGGIEIQVPVTLEEKMSMPWLGACMSTNFGTGPSCLYDSSDGRKLTTITPDLMRKKLVECERETLRYLVDKRSGCAVRVPGIANVWQAAQNHYLEITVAKEDRRRYKVVKNDLFECGRENIDDNKRNLNILKQMCIERKDLIASKCDRCKLKTLVDDVQAQAVFECVNDRLAKPDDNAAETIKDCMRKVEAKHTATVAAVC